MLKRVLVSVLGGLVVLGQWTSAAETMRRLPLSVYRDRMIGGWLGQMHTYGSEMALNFWTAIFSWTTCFVVTILVSAVTESAKPDAELRGLVYSLTPRVKDDATARWYSRPETLAVIVLAVTVALNVIFW